MTISEKLVQIAENSPKVYQKGYDNGFAEGASADYKDGERAANVAFWDALTNNGERTDYGYAFSNWSSEYIRPTRKIVPTSSESARSTFFKCPNLKKIESACFDFSQKTKGTSATSGYSYTFYNCGKLEEIEDIGIKADFSFNHAFECGKLRTIAKIGTDENTQFTSAFDYAYSLENVTFEGVIGQNLNIRWSKQLSADSIRNIIEHLSDTAEGKTLTLSKKAVDNADFSRSATIYATVNGATNGAFILPCNISLSEGESLKVTLEVEDGHHYNDCSHDGNYSPDEWYVGVSCYANEPNNKEVEIPYTYAALTDGQVSIDIYFITGGEASFKFKVRAVKIDADGKEIDGENLYSVPDGSYEFYDGIGYTLAEESWEALQASKPNWTISLV